MMDDWYEDDYDFPCPECDHFTRGGDCPSIFCEDGAVDLHEYDDPINFSPGETEPCDECGGYGFVRWCPACGWDHAGLDIFTAMEGSVSEGE